MKLIILASILACLGCSRMKAETNPYVCYQSITPSNGKPSILVIGDSISYGYLPYLQNSLINYDIVHNPCNAFNSTITLMRVNEWLSARPKWGAVTWNNGLWDIAAWSYVDGDDYRRNLTEIAKKIKQHTDHPLFVLTTYVPPGAEGRQTSAVPPRNQIAIQVMQSEGIPVVDLYSLSLGMDSYRLDPKNVHYASAGYSILANELLGTLQTIYGVH